MTVDDLNKYRLYIPGLAWIFAMRFLLAPAWPPTLSFSDVGLPIVLGIVFGAIHYTLGLRPPLFYYVDDAIQQRMLKIIRRGPASHTQAELAYLAGDRRLMSLFYSVLDSDESLKVKQDAVRLNGLVVTSLVDVTLVVQVSAVLHYGIGSCTLFVPRFFWTGGCYLAWLLLETLLVPKALDRHHRLSNEQLDVIDHLHSSKVQSGAATILQRMRLSGVEGGVHGIADPA